MKLALLSGGYPPDFDAIGQYTRCLAGSLVQRGNEVAVFCGFSAPQDRNDLPDQQAVRKQLDDPQQIIRFFDPAHPGSLRGLGDSFRQLGKRDWLIVQFNPFGFGPRGWCPALPGVLERLRREQGVRIAIYFHETHVPPWPLKFAIMLCWQYPIFARLAAMADLTFVSTTRWKRQVCRWRSEDSCHAIPVGSNLPLCPLSKAEARRQLVLPDIPVLGVFGNSHPSRLIEWIAEAAREAGRISPGALLLYVGKDGAEIARACQASALRFEDHGALPDEDASLRLRAMDVLISPFVDGISTRRSSVIAGLQHDVTILTTLMPQSDPLMVEHPLINCSPVAAGPAAFAGLAGEWAAGKISQAHAPDFATSPFAWESIAADICGKLEKFQ
jgi:glycosyltransferase involved in cell wall biosynthesis